MFQYRPLFFFYFGGDDKHWLRCGQRMLLCDIQSVVICNKGWTPFCWRVFLYYRSNGGARVKSLFLVASSHCKENPIYVFLSGNCAASVPISTFNCVCERFIYPGFIHIHVFFCRRIGRASVGIYINRSQTHECGEWDCGLAIPFLGILYLFQIFGMVSL
jgi:hypothetical protein